MSPVCLNKCQSVLYIAAQGGQGWAVWASHMWAHYPYPQTLGSQLGLRADLLGVITQPLLPLNTLRQCVSCIAIVDLPHELQLNCCILCKLLCEC
jgi:hypothetical protein